MVCNPQQYRMGHSLGISPVNNFLRIFHYSQQNKLSFGDRCNVRKKLLVRDQIKFTGLYVQSVFTKDVHNMQNNRSIQFQLKH